jgi:hypothetical protein
MQPQSKFAQATKNILLHIGELTRGTAWLVEPTKVSGFIHTSFLLPQPFIPQSLLPQTVSSTIRACAVQAVTHKRLA